MEARGDFWSVGGLYLSPSSDAHRTNLCTERVIIPFSVKIHGRCKANKNQFGQFGRVQFDDLWNTDGNKILSEKWIGSTRFRILNKRVHTRVRHGWMVNWISN